MIVWGWDARQGTAHSVSLLPLVPWRNIQERELSENHKTSPGRLMVDYHDLSALPRFTLYG